MKVKLREVSKGTGGRGEGGGISEGTGGRGVGLGYYWPG